MQTPTAAGLLTLIALMTARAHAGKMDKFSDAKSPAQPRLAFQSVCDPLSYNGMYLKHQLELPIRLDLSPVGDLKILEIDVRVDDAIMKWDPKVLVTAQLTLQPGFAHLIFLCPTFFRCQQLKEAVDSNPEALWRSIQFTVTGRIGDQAVRFQALRTDNLPSFACDPARWVVFQRRVDGNLSFVQNWDAYVNGFGSPDSNYWMGLDQLFKMTASASKNGYPDTSRCRLRVELQDFSGRSYWGEYGMFQVLDPGLNYQLRLGLEVAGSQLPGFVERHGEMPFSTFDRDNDKHGSDSCSKMFGFGGWWYNSCHYVNLNGAYLTDKGITNDAVYASFYSAGRSIPVKRSLMMFKCG